MIVLFAIPNCDTVKKARAFLVENKIDYEFHDFKKSPPSKAQIDAWSQFAGALPVNRQGMTYRKYKDHYEALTQSEKIDFIIANTSLIKRPILVQDERVLALGFKEEEYRVLLKKL